MQPQLVYSGQNGRGVSKDDKYSVFAEQQHLFDIRGTLDAMLALLATYFVFDMSYPKSIRNTMTFLQLCVLKVAPKAKPPKTVSRVINLLSKGAIE